MTAASRSTVSHTAIYYRPAGQRKGGCPVRLIPRRHLAELRRRYRQARPAVSSKVTPLQARVQARIQLVGYLSAVSDGTVTAAGETFRRVS